MESELVSRYHEICGELNMADHPVRLMGVTKTIDVDVINCLIDEGLDLIGENRVQEFLSKYDCYHKENLEIHFIGHLQRNKVKYIIDKVSMIESVDSIALAEEIQKQAKKHGLVMDILVEVNVGREESKSGVLLENLNDLIDFIATQPNLRLRGLMSIVPICEQKEQLYGYFSKMHKLFLDIKAKKLDNGLVDCLSMGMSGDYKDAIACGSTQVRIGRYLFGNRKP